MSATAAEPAPRTSWRCSGCGMVVRNASGAPIPLPRSWSDEPSCIRCQQYEMREGRRGAGADRTELVRFELLRGRPVSEAARTAGVQPKVAAAERRALVESGALAPSAKSEPRPKKKPSPSPAAVAAIRQQAQRDRWAKVREKARARIEVALAHDSERPDKLIAEACGSTKGAVKRAREGLGLHADPVSAQGKRERDIALVLSRPEGVTSTAFAAARGLTRAAASRRLNRLVAEGLVVADGDGRAGVSRVYRTAGSTCGESLPTQ